MDKRYSQSHDNPIKNFEQGETLTYISEPFF